MLNKEQVQRAIKEVDNAVAQLNGTREVHLRLVNDLQLIQQCCMDYFDDENELNELKEDVKDVGTNESIERPETCDQDK